MKSKRLVLLTAATALLFFFSQALASEWYQDGTLHKATGKVWRTSSTENRLATSADFATVVWKGKVSSMEEFKPYAVQLEACITEATKSDAVSDTAVTEVASACVVVLGWL